MKLALLKKLFVIKDPFVQRSFYKMLSSFAKSFPGMKYPGRPADNLDVAQRHEAEYLHYVKKGMSSVDSTTINEFTDLLVNSLLGTQSRASS